MLRENALLIKENSRSLKGILMGGGFSRSFVWFVYHFPHGPVNFKRTPACTQTLFHFIFILFENISEHRASTFFFPIPTPLRRWSINLRGFYFLSRLLDGLWRENSSLRSRRLKRKGKGVWGARETRGARNEGESDGNTCQGTIVFAIPLTNYASKNTANCEWLAIK